MYNINSIYNILDAGLGLVVLLVVFVYAFSTAFLGRWVAEKKGYSSISWFWICFFFGIFGLIAIAGVPINQKYKYRNTPIYTAKSIEEAKPGEEKCPHCGGYYDFAFKKCPHCGIERNSNTTEYVKRDIENESYNIKCSKCDRVIKVDGKVEEFKQYTCPYCKHKINEKNVIFFE